MLLLRYMALQAQLLFFFFTFAMRSRDTKLFSVSKSALILSAGNDTSSRTCMETSREKRGHGPECRGDAAAGAPHPRIMQVRMQCRAAQSRPEPPTAAVRTYHEDAPLRACFLAFSRNTPPPFGIPPPQSLLFAAAAPPLNGMEWL